MSIAKRRCATRDESGDRLKDREVVERTYPTSNHFWTTSSRDGLGDNKTYVQFPFVL